MKLFVILLVAVCLVLDVIKCSTLEESGLLAEEPRTCAKPNESCSKGRYGHGPTECCPPKGCSCNPFTRNCDCSWTAVSHWFD
uniref:U22-Deinotoxin-Dsu1b_1 n=1 Tax=Deinopis subrufa TaxID=1905329 RepID=A0A4Q8K8W4_DEISU